MGHVLVDAELVGAKKERVRMLVDTGATYSVLPVDLAERLEITEAPRRLKVRLADGRRKSMRVGTVFVRLLGREAADTALIAPAGVEPLLGAEALEALGLAVDPTSRKLKPTRAHAVLLVSIRGAHVVVVLQFDIARVTGTPSRARVGRVPPPPTPRPQRRQPDRRGSRPRARGRPRHPRMRGILECH